MFHVEHFERLQNGVYNMTMEVRKLKPVRSALGRGLSALISTPVPTTPPVERMMHSMTSEPAEELPTAPAASLEGVTFLEVDALVNNASQPRQEFKQEELSELANSIRTLGILQPVLVRPLAN